MKCLIFFLATILFSQIAAVPRRRHWDRSRGRSIITNSDNDALIHPPWWQGATEDKPTQLEPNGPFGPFEAFDINLGGFEENSSEEDTEVIRKTQPTGIPSFGGSIWWRPPFLSSSTTDRNSPVKPSNPTGNNIRDQITQCVTSCRVTSEFNPVCGSNNVTYSNPGRLECEQKCGVDVQLSRLTACSVPPSNHTELNPSLDNVTACVKNCSVTSEYSPVCGSNNVTYANHGLLLCDKFCGILVELSKLSPCSSTEPKKPSSEEQLACMRFCPVTGEYNPVCGSNNVTYSNPGRLECAQYCGVEVTLSKLSACGGVEPATTTENTLTSGGFAALCMRSCPVTSEYNPVCGSNNVTYTNHGRLECAQNCGVEVTLVKNTSCEASVTTEENKNNINTNTTTELNLILTTSSTTARPYVNVNGESNVNIGNNETKDINSSETNENDSDQGKDENNNNNAGQSNLSGDSNEKSGSKGRPGYGNNRPNGNEGNNGHYGYNDCKGEINNKKPPSIKEVMECMQTCSLTSEANPVCGTDSVTYMNPGRLLCAQFCGVDVKVKKFAPCESMSITNFHCPTTCTNSPVTDNPGPVTPPLPSIEACMEACPASVEFTPVCGSNNVTYRNLEKLQCARRCGIDVSMKRNTHCAAPDPKLEPKDNASLILECIQQCYIPQKYEPVCGSNNVTYNNTGHLICARQCGLDIQLKESHPCSTTPVVSPTGTSDKVVDPNNNGSNITIDSAILASIWGTTSTTPTDGDEDFELDHRIQDQQ